MRRSGFLLALLLLLSGCGADPAVSDALARYRQAGTEPGTWVRVPAGRFAYGQYGHETLIDRDFLIMKTEVTNAQFARYLERAAAAGAVKITDGAATGSYRGDVFRSGRHEEPIPAGDYRQIVLDDPASRITFNGGKFEVKEGYAEHPVTMVSWFGALAYCEAAGGRLPNEEEWEYAARGTDGRPYPHGEQVQSGNANYYHSGDPFEGPDGWSDTTPVGFYNGQKYGEFQTDDSPSPFGLYDMAGNAAEWTGSVYPQQHYRYIRGGSAGQSAIDSRVWYRNSAHPSHVSPRIGFRCVRDLPEGR